MLELAGIDAFYDDSHILQAVSLKVGSHERVAVLGRNGAGKSTLLKSIMNAGTRVAGSLKWEGQELGASKAHRRARLGIAMVPEDRRIFSHLTVRENIAMARMNAGRKQADAEAGEIIARIPMLAELGNRPGGELSGGQQQMVAVARGLAARPKLILLDEPTEGLAPLIVENMAADIVAQCKVGGVALLLCEQNIWFARKCTDRLYILDSGRVVFEGAWPEFDSQPEVASRYLAV